MTPVVPAKAGTQKRDAAGPTVVPAKAGTQRRGADGAPPVVPAKAGTQEGRRGRASRRSRAGGNPRGAARPLVPSPLAGEG